MSFDAAVLSQLRKRMADVSSAEQARVCAGQCTDYAEYRYSVGYFKCLSDIETIIQEITSDIQKG